ncbi:hypothetical protein [Prevotella lacticifex]|jgi:hypothetical protein|uniref:hypothetical protein n=2 Tax=Prevotella TaxID=838 RepID=UPI001CC5AEEA|nr:hypothetical protein [Prevotella lacticifex]MDY6265934.1 hypothetical protein [Prevotella sp.]
MNFAASAVLQVFLAVASLRHEGCFFSVAGLPKLASEQGGDGEETMGEALANASGFIWFLSEDKECSRPAVNVYDAFYLVFVRR